MNIENFENNLEDLICERLEKGFFRSDIIIYFSLEFYVQLTRDPRTYWLFLNNIDYGSIYTGEVHGCRFFVVRDKIEHPPFSVVIAK